MSQAKQNKKMNPKQDDESKTTKIFVGGLAWETKRETLKCYFDQFGEILEAVVITDRRTGKSKGYGFVTFKEPNSATLACQNPYPEIDGRKANCNIAALGAQKTESFKTGRKKLNSPSRNMVPTQFQSPSIYYNQYIIPQYTFSHPAAYWYPGYPSQQDIYEMNYYNVYGGQQFPYCWFPAYYQPLYGLSKQFVPTSYEKKTSQELAGVRISEPVSPLPSNSTTETVAAKGVLGPPQDQKSSASASDGKLQKEC